MQVTLDLLFEDIHGRIDMGFDIEWFVHGRIIKANISGDIAIEDLKNGSDIALKMFEESDAPLVHVITNETDVGSLPVSLQLFSEAVEFMRHPRMGWMLMYPTANQLSKFLSGMVAGIAKVRYRRFESIEESLQFLVSVDTTLPSIEEMLGL